MPFAGHNEAFEKHSISFKIKAHEDFNYRNISNISRIKIRMQRRDWEKGGVFQRSHNGNHCQPNDLKVYKEGVFLNIKQAQSAFPPANDLFVFQIRIIRKAISITRPSEEGVFL